jgi:hypothetical protein
MDQRARCCKATAAARHSTSAYQHALQTLPEVVVAHGKWQDC